MPVWTLTLDRPFAPGRARRQLAVVAVEVRPQLVGGRVVLADLADLAADAHRDAVGLEAADERGQLRRAEVVLALLRVAVRLRQVDEGGAVDVDVAVAGVDGEAARAADLLGHRLRVRRVLLRVELVVVALDEHGVRPARGDRPGEHRRRVVHRPLEGVGLLAAGQLEDQRPDVRPGGGLVERPRHVEGLGADVERRHGEPVDLAARSRLVQALDAGGPGAQRLARLPDDPAGGLGGRVVGRERGRPGEVGGRFGAEAGGIVDDEALAVDVGDAGEVVDQVRDGRGDVGHGVSFGCRPDGSPERGETPCRMAQKRLDDHQDHDHDDQEAEDHAADAELACRGRDLRAGRCPRCRRGRRELDQLLAVPRLPQEREDDRNDVQRDPNREPESRADGTLVSARDRDQDQDPRDGHRQRDRRHQLARATCVRA